MNKIIQIIAARILLKKSKNLPCNSNAGWKHRLDVWLDGKIRKGDYMANTLRKKGAKYNTTFCSFVGLSTDTKPTGTVLVNDKSVTLSNGSEFIEMDTDKKYAYDADNEQWIER